MSKQEIKTNVLILNNRAIRRHKNKGEKRKGNQKDTYAFTSLVDCIYSFVRNNQA